MIRSYNGRRLMPLACAVMIAIGAMMTLYSCHRHKNARYEGDTLQALRETNPLGVFRIISEVGNSSILLIINQEGRVIVPRAVDMINITGSELVGRKLNIEANANSLLSIFPSVVYFRLKTNSRLAEWFDDEACSRPSRIQWDPL